MERFGGYNTVLAVQDTTDFCFSHHPATKELGPLGNTGMVGFFVHSCLALSPEGVPLGLLGQYRWVRSFDELGILEDSARAIPSTTRVVTVADREADIIDFFLTELALRVAAVTLQAPQHRRPERLPLAPLTAIWAHELTPPEGKEPISWLLLTTLSVQSENEAAMCVRWYAHRWKIERYHYTLKSGCRLEELQLESVDRLDRAVAIFAVGTSRSSRLVQDLLLALGELRRGDRGARRIDQVKVEVTGADEP